eukprot:9454719-Pyramimonas_sp.AAC.1
MFGFRREMCRFLFLATLLGRILGALWGVLAASEIAWRPSAASKGDLSAKRGPRGPSGQLFWCVFGKF